MQEQHGEEKAAPPTVREDLIFRQLDEEWVVYDSAGEKLHVLNATAALVWVHCTGDHSVADISREIATAYEGKVDRDLIDEDVRRTIQEFADKGFLL